MMIKWNNIIITTILIMSITMALSMNNWLMIWMMMEINLMTFVPIIKMNNKESSSSMMIYFIAQSVGSTTFLFSLLSSWLYFPYNYESMTESMIVVSMMVKLGMPPSHAWMIMMIENMTWNTCFIFMTVQKIMPMMVIFQTKTWTIMIMSVMATVLGSIGGINQTSLKKMMAYSSMTHMGWMSMLTTSNKWMLYLMLYMLLMLPVIMFLSKNNLMFINQLSMTQKSNQTLFSMSMLSLAGLPPFSGFMLKWIGIQSVMSTKMLIPLIIMLMMSLVTLFFYMSIITPMMLQSTISNKSTNNPMLNLVTTFTILCMPIMMIMNLT